ncbi:MAG TPA: aldolase/citrate lyase family protein [Verrucomicrobiae bacterium]|jgi:4-hydroxy-2-oxoheptanedioate aldolase
MQVRPSRLLEKIRAGQIPVTLKMNLADARVVELAGLSGADAVWLCNEHVPNDWLNVENMIRAARVHDMDCIVRVAKGSYSDYIKPFEAGATGIMVPHVTTADEARRIVEMTRFQPQGRRPIDGGNIDGKFCLISTADYVVQCNAEQFLILQIESPEALANVEQIAAVPGFNGLLFGAGDFSHLIGKAGQVNSPETTAARKRVAAVARANGKFAMTPGLIAPWEEQAAEGYNVFNLGADVIGLGDYFRTKVAEFAKGPVAKVASVYR